MPRRTLMHKEIEKLKEQFLLLGAKVEDNLRQAVRSIRERDEELARKIIESDRDVNQMEVDIEEECLKVLALHQPVAIDLRLVIAVLKITNELERVGDLAANIADHTVFFVEQGFVEFPYDFFTMAEKTQNMLRLSLDALARFDAGLAHEVRRADDEVDTIHEQMYPAVEEAIRANPERVDHYIRTIGLSRCLERIADLSTNIAEDTIYLIEGEIVRHARDSLPPKADLKLVES